MGFKRTSEGRVFFTGSGQVSNDAEDDDRFEAIKNRYSRFEPPSVKDVTERRSDASRGLSHGSQLQLLSLLKSLNEKLKLTQVERNSMRHELDAYRQSVQSLEEKTQANEQAFEKLKEDVSNQKQLPVPTGMVEELEETRRLCLRLENRTERVDRYMQELMEQSEQHKQVSVNMSRKQTELERQYKQTLLDLETGNQGSGLTYQALLDRLEKTESKQDEMDGKLHATLSGQERIEGLLEADRSDRMRFLKNFERLEAAVELFQHEFAAERPKPLPELDVAEDVEAIDQGPGGHLPEHLRRAVDEAMQSPAQEQGLSAFARRIWRFGHHKSQVPVPVLVVSALALVTLGGGIAFMQQNPIPLSNPFVSSAPKVVQQTQDFTGWEFSADAGGFVPTNKIAEQLSDIDIAREIKKADEGVMPENFAATLNQIEPGNEQQTQIFASNPVETLKPAVVKPKVTTPKAVAPVVLDYSQPNPALPSAFKQLEAQAIAGSSDAQHDLAALYIVEDAGVQKDYARAAYWFDKAAQGGVANAAYNLGVLYHQGLGVDQNIEQAIRWYRLAADKGHAEAQYNLGIAYIEGVGVEYDPMKAALHFENAAQNGAVEAAYNLGLIYENGLLGAPQPGKALMWYKRAADQGLVEAQSALKQLTNSLNINPADIEKVVNEVEAREVGASLSVPTRAQPVSTSLGRANNQVIQTRDAQRYLLQLGLYPGPVDGSLGPMTRDAVRSYQSNNGLPVTGDITESLLQHMAQQI